LAGLEFRVLGPLEVRRDGELLAVTAPMQRALLSLLLLRANEPVPQDELIAGLWGEDSPRTARASVQNHVHMLRRRLGADQLVREPAGYVVRVEPGQLDLERFRRLVAEARGAPAPERAARLRDALALWRGPAFVDLAGDPWARPEVVTLEDERLGALEERIDAELELGEHVVLVPELEGLVERHPLRERLWAQLMMALYRTGRQADALATYRRAHHAFVEALGLEPGVVLRELQRAVLVQDPVLDDPRRQLGSTLERAAAILPREPRDRAESLHDYGLALIRLGELRQAMSTLEAARRLAETAREPMLEARVRLQLSYLAVFTDGRSMGEHLAAAEAAARAFRSLGDDAGLALALSQQAHMLRDTGHADRGRELATRGVRLAMTAGDAATEATCRRTVAHCAVLGSTPVDEAIALCEAQIEATRGGKRPVSVWEAMAWLLAQAGRIAEARALYERELERLREQGIVWGLLVGRSYAAFAERAVGRLELAADHLRTAYGLVDAVSMRGDRPGVAGELACVLALQGDLAGARGLAEESRRLATPGDVLSELVSRRALALIAAREGRHEEAVLLSDEARERVAETDWLTIRGETLEESAVVHRLIGDATGEAEALTEALALYERKGNVAGAERVRLTLAGSDPWGLTPPTAQQSK